MNKNVFFLLKREKVLKKKAEYAIMLLSFYFVEERSLF